MKSTAAELPQNYRRITIMRHMDDCRKIAAAKPPLKGGYYAAVPIFAASSFPTMTAAKLELRTNL
jgi:hypothetical protein